MEKFSTSLARFSGLILATLLALPAGAQVKVVEGKYSTNLKTETNYVKNSGCWVNARDISNTGGTLARSVLNPLENGASCLLDASASGQMFKWSTVAVDAGLTGQDCEASFLYKGDASLYKAYVNVGGVKASQEVSLDSSTVFPKIASFSFPCRTQPATTEVVIESGSSSAASMDVSKVYFGPDRNKTSGTLVTPWVAYTPTVSNLGTGGLATNLAKWRRVGDSIEVQHYMVKDGSGGSGSLAVTVSLPAGLQGDESRLANPTNLNKIGDVNDAAAGQGGSVFWNLGGNTAYFYSLPNTSGQFNGSAFLANKTIVSNWRVPIIGWSASNAVASGNQKAPTYTRLTSGTAATYTVPPGAVFLRVTVQGGGGGGAGADTDNVYSGSGGGGGGCARAGIPFPAASYLYTIGSAGSGTAAATSPSTGGTGGTTTFGSILSAIGGTGGVGGTDGGSSGEGGTATVTGYTGEIFAGNPGGVNNIAGAQTGAGGGGGCYGGAGGASKSTNGTGTAGIANTGGGGGGGTATSGNGGNGATGVIFIEEYYSMGSVPLFVGSVASNTVSGRIRTETAYVTNNGSVCTVVRDNGSNWLGSPTRTASGTCGFVLSGWQTAPNCDVNQVGNGSNAPIGVCTLNSAPSTTSLSIACGNNGFAAADRDFVVSCSSL